MCLAVKLLILHRLRTILVITGDCLDRLDSSSSGLRASCEPLRGGPIAVWKLKAREGPISQSDALLPIYYVDQMTTSLLMKWQGRWLIPFNGHFLLFARVYVSYWFYDDYMHVWCDHLWSYDHIDHFYGRQQNCKTEYLMCSWCKELDPVKEVGLPEQLLMTLSWQMAPSLNPCLNYPAGNTRKFAALWNIQ